MISAISKVADEVGFSCQEYDAYFTTLFSCRADDIQEGRCAPAAYAIIL